MSERRLLDREDLPLARALIAATKEDTPSPQSTARMLEALGVATGTVVVAGAASKEIGALAGKGAFAASKWILLLSTAVAATAAIAVFARPSRVDPPAAIASVTPAPSPPVSVEVPSAIVEVPAPAPSIVPKPTTTIHKSVTSNAPTSTPKVAPPSLKDAVALIDAARAALAAHHPDETLAALNRHDAELPSSPLGPESTVLRAEALFMRGDHEAARSLARRIVEQMPGTANARRAQKVLDALDE